MKLKKVDDLPDAPALVEPKRDNGAVRLAPSHISVFQPDGSKVPIPTLEVSESTQMLGVHFNPAGNGVPHMEVMIKKGDEWFDCLRTRPLEARDA